MCEKSAIWEVTLIASKTKMDEREGFENFSKGVFRTPSVAAVCLPHQKKFPIKSCIDNREDFNHSPTLRF